MNIQRLLNRILPWRRLMVENPPKLAVFYFNGFTTIYDHSGNQIEDLQLPWFKIVVNWLKRKGVDPTRMWFQFETGQTYKIIQHSKDPSIWTWHMEEPPILTDTFDLSEYHDPLSKEIHNAYLCFLEEHNQRKFTYAYAYEYAYRDALRPFTLNEWTIIDLQNEKTYPPGQDFVTIKVKEDNKTPYSTIALFYWTTKEFHCPFSVPNGYKIPLASVERWRRIPSAFFQ